MVPVSWHVHVRWHNWILHTLIHTLALESSPPNIVVAPIKPDINISAIDVYLAPLNNISDLHIISKL